MDIKAVIKNEDGTREVTAKLSEEQTKTLLEYALVSLIQKGFIHEALVQAANESEQLVKMPDEPIVIN